MNKKIHIDSIDISAESKEYWMSKSLDNIDKFKIKYDFAKQRTYKKEQHSVMLSQSLSEKIIGISKNNDILVFTILSAVAILNLHKYSSENDITIGIPGYGKGKKNKLLPLLIKLDGDSTFKKLIVCVQKLIIECYKNQYFPLENVLKLLKINNSLMELTSINTMMKGLHTEEYIEEITNSVENDISLCIEKKDTYGISINIIFNSALYNKDTIERFLEHYLIILEEGLNNSNKKISDIEILTEKDKNRILYEFNDTAIDYPKNKTIQELFEEQVQEKPKSIAVLYEEQKLSFKELNEKANQVARLLRTKGVQSNKVVGIMVERSLEMIIGIMGIIKAGGAYLPIDPNYPNERIEYMLKDSEAELLLIQSKFINKVSINEEKTIILDNQQCYQGDSSNLNIINTPTDLSYIIYTSGSTGKPKGVMIEHGSLINRINWMQKAYAIYNDDVILQKTSYTFDVSVWELFWWAFTGAKLCFLPPEGEKDAKVITNCIKESQITTMHFVPSMLNVFLDYVENNDVMDKLVSLKQVFSSGEALKIKQVQRFNRLLNKNNGTKLYNLYGPTEGTIDVSHVDCSTQEPVDIVSIGKPIDNIKLYIVNNSMNLQPIGISGELCISGVGLARGYINRLELTKEKFVKNPFIDSLNIQQIAGKHDVMYKTGDLARWLPDGNIEFLGRLDDQVKIRGFRIELGEIENQLLKHKNIKESAVIVNEDENKGKYLCGYIVGDEEEEELTITELRKHLSKELPEYMIPQYFVKLDKMPITSNGKTNKKLLPKPDNNIDTGVEYVTPRNETEEKLVEIWGQILSVEKIGINDNFFDLGGHSLKVTRMIAKIYKEFDLEIPIMEFFSSLTIKTISEYISNKSTSSIYENTKEVKKIELLNKIKQEDRKDIKGNIFFIHDVSGDIQGYRELSNRLDDKYNCWGLRSSTLDNYGPLNITIEKIASKYIKEIKKVQEYGPYIIAGWSLGGVVAFEVVRQLEDIGEEVKSLILFDSQAPEEKVSKKNSSIMSKNKFDYMTEKKYIDKLSSNREIRNYINDIKNIRDIEELWEKVVKTLKEKGLDTNLIKSLIPLGMREVIPHFEVIDIESLIKYVNTNRTLGNAWQIYKPKSKLKVQVHYIEAVETNEIDPDNWNKYLMKDMISEEIKGNHFTIFKSPYVEELAKKVREIIG